MILLCTFNGQEVDRITVNGRMITYDTLAAQSTVEAKIDQFGHTLAIKMLRSGWSNGYVSISEE